VVHVGVLRMRFASAAEAAAAAGRYSACPKVHFWGAKGAEATIILKVPEGGLFWSDYIRDNPGTTFGGVEASLEYLDAVSAPASIGVSREKVDGDVSPCGSACKNCPSLRRCGGCPALNLQQLLDHPSHHLGDGGAAGQAGALYAD
jgi:hypothetical protein